MSQPEKINWHHGRGYLGEQVPARFDLTIEPGDVWRLKDACRSCKRYGSELNAKRAATALVRADWVRSEKAKAGMKRYKLRKNGCFFDGVCFVLPKSPAEVLSTGKTWRDSRVPRVLAKCHSYGQHKAEVIEYTLKISEERVV